MKGISAIVATILMLLITITLAGVAYTFTMGTWTSQTQGIDIDDSYCIGNQVKIIVRNIGTNNISSVTCSQTAPAIDATCDFTGALTTQIGPGMTQEFVDACGGEGGRSCNYRIVPSTGKSVTVTAYCTG